MWEGLDFRVWHKYLQRSLSGFFSITLFVHKNMFPFFLSFFFLFLQPHACSNAACERLVGEGPELGPYHYNPVLHFDLPVVRCHSNCHHCLYPLSTICGNVVWKPLFPSLRFGFGPVVPTYKRPNRAILVETPVPCALEGH